MQLLIRVSSFYVSQNDISCSSDFIHRIFSLCLYFVSGRVYLKKVPLQYIVGSVMAASKQYIQWIYYVHIMHTLRKEQSRMRLEAVARTKKVVRLEYI